MSRDFICMLDGVSKSFHVKKGFFAGSSIRIDALRNVTLSIVRNEILGVVGESGCGKSTMARVILGLEPVSCGAVLFEGKDISAFDKDALKAFRKRAQMVFQDPLSSLNPKKTIFQIIAKPLRIHGLCSKRELRDEVRRLLAMCGLEQPGIEDRYPHEFSGGQRQRIGIARAIATDPELVILDEPTSALDVSVQAQIINLILDLQAKRRMSCVFISHDLPLVEFVSTRVVVMYKGCIVEIMPREAFSLKDMGSMETIHHPYTEYLLSAVPIPDPAKKTDTWDWTESERAALVQEVVPEGLRDGNGDRCPFMERCPRRGSRCGEEMPVLTELAQGHFVACHEIDHL